MLKKIGLSVAALCAALALAKPPAAAAADRDDYNYRSSDRYSEGRNSYQGYSPYGYSEGRNSYQGYKRQERFRNDYQRGRRGRDWRENDGRDQRQRWNDRDRYNSFRR
jgi:hypothetical protein